MRYFEKFHIESAMKRGKEVEQFLGTFITNGKPAISWLTIRKQEDGYVLMHHEQYDEGSPDYLDIYDFSYINLPEYRYEPEHEVYSTLDEALNAAKTIGASDDKWVGHGMAQDEYLDHVHKST